MFEFGLETTRAVKCIANGRRPLLYFFIIENGDDTMISNMSDVKTIISECILKMIRTHLLVENSP